MKNMDIERHKKMQLDLLKMRMLRPDWGPKYIVGNPKGNRFECYLSELEDWERGIPCERCDDPFGCRKPCYAYDNWLSNHPLRRKCENT